MPEKNKYAKKRMLRRRGKAKQNVLIAGMIHFAFGFSVVIGS